MTENVTSSEAERSQCQTTTSYPILSFP